MRRKSKKLIPTKYRLILNYVIQSNLEKGIKRRDYVKINKGREA